ncbi:hypothetical protein LY90DRAFT_670174 [Neocallimastix californiae]|uniref:Uncharacterized protein n=1 Tax=Neocallimastix californiae TaxID=1754190 RepID=A0A1Y2D577_9FUNG|nr:hypothetical protein LY90DRAFT_670174 [Neocallimastix californiae]|eukprot:ORY54246.1 hypothetical protein LY90DRAFT_670174 [Neocallimastix californiae]
MIEEKHIDDIFGTFLNITVDILDNVNDTQHYIPGLTFILVLYVYQIIGEGRVWKYLLSATFFGFLGSLLTAVFNACKGYFPLDYILQIKWFEAISWHLNEYGYVYISYLKLRIVVNELQKNYWKYIMNGVFLYNLIVRLIIATVTIVGRKNSAGSHLLGFTFFPLSIVEIVFMFLIIKTFIKQTNGSKIQKIGLIYLLSSCVCYFYAPPILKSVKSVIWRAKAALGLIFLLDLLFIRIDITTQINVGPSFKHKINDKTSNELNSDLYRRDIINKNSNESNVESAFNILTEKNTNSSSNNTFLFSYPKMKDSRHSFVNLSSINSNSIYYKLQ